MGDLLIDRSPFLSFFYPSYRHSRDRDSPHSFLKSLFFSKSFFLKVFFSQSLLFSKVFFSQKSSFLKVFFSQKSSFPKISWPQEALTTFSPTEIPRRSLPQRPKAP